MLPNRMGVVGVGLIGASVAASFKKAGVAEILAYSPNEDVLFAQRQGWVDQVCGSVEETVTEVDFLVLAPPISEFPDIFHRIRNAVSPHVVLTDCASVKCPVVDAARLHLSSIFSRYVPGHPIAGSENSGAFFATPDLFLGKPWVLCSGEDQEASPLFSVVASWLAQATRAHVVTMSPERHDKLFAELSHWPHALSFALSNAVSSGEWGKEELSYQGQAFKDVTRVSASSPELWADILLFNRDFCLEASDRFSTQLEKICTALVNRDRASLIQLFSCARNWKKSI